MENKRTAVEWLENELAFFLKDIIENKNHLLMINLFEQAKEMEKEQIIDAWNDGYEKGLRVREEKIINPVFDAETYYDDTYGN